MKPNDYIESKMTDEDKPCYLCKHSGEDPNFIGDEYCNLLEIAINDWGTCKHYEETKIPQATRAERGR